MSEPQDEVALLEPTVAIEQVGWRFLLGAGNNDHILCFDTALGAVALALAPLCNRIWVVHVDSSALNLLRRRLRNEGVTNACFTLIEAGIDRLPFRNARFDAIIVPSVEAVLSRTSSARSTQMLDGLIGEARRMLRRGGYLFFTVRNRRLRELFASFRGDKDRPTSVSSRVLRHSLARNAFLQVRAYPLLLGGELVTEILVEGRYRSVRTSFATKGLVAPRRSPLQHGCVCVRC